MLRAPRLHAALATTIAVVVLVAATGCGSDSTHANRDRPPTPIVITASINTGRVAVSPASFGAGPIKLVVVNQTDRSQQITLETADQPGSGRPGIRQQTGPINPNDTASLSADVSRGSYRVHVGRHGIKPATLAVGRRRPSSQQDLLIP